VDNEGGEPTEGLNSCCISYKQLGVTTSF
jgi:hypothetical protein